MFKDRKSAGLALANELKHHIWDPQNTVIIGLPRGGVKVAAQVASTLELPLDIFCVKKIGHPHNPELAMGAVTEDGDVHFNQRVKSSARMTDGEIDSLTNHYFKEAKAQAELLRSHLKAMSVKNKTVIVVDDGVATGASVHAVIKLLRKKGVKKIVLAVPLAPSDIFQTIGIDVDKYVVLETPSYFSSVGQWYKNFEQVSNEEVIAILKSFYQKQENLAQSRNININATGANLRGRLTALKDAKAWIVFVHGSGSSHLSPRNNRVAQVLNKHGFSTLLFDLLTPKEDSLYENRFNIDLLAKRLTTALAWLMDTDEYQYKMPIGLFGASTGAAAAIVAAAGLQNALPLYAIVCRGGRPDLAGEKLLKRVHLPTLLIVGEKDHEVVKLNQLASSHLCRGEIKLVPDATHLFEEKGCIEEVAHLSVQWFRNKLKKKFNEPPVHPNFYL